MREVGGAAWAMLHPGLRGQGEGAVDYFLFYIFCGVGGYKKRSPAGFGPGAALLWGLHGGAPSCKARTGWVWWEWR